VPVAEIGYTLSSEEFGPNELVRCAVRCEEVGFDFASISDHFHPWVDRQGNSPFVGYDHVYFHQVGPDQEGFLQFAERELLPRLADVRG
jgi:alkanesulfonate monooxygenase SsuD/methylene tetrahydromethanopterin reductase-like flavin-dependent oxidoreductase (luciferase family)